MWARLDITSEVAQVSGRLGYIFWGGLLACMDVPGILGEFAQVCRRLGYAGRVGGGSNTWRALGISGAHLAAKLILKRGEINFKSNEF